MHHDEDLTRQPRAWKFGDVVTDGAGSGPPPDEDAAFEVAQLASSARSGRARPLLAEFG
jgi:hypothetical protein